MLSQQVTWASSVGPRKIKVWTRLREAIHSGTFSTRVTTVHLLALRIPYRNQVAPKSTSAGRTQP
jgi:hypothetical protein